MPRPRLLAVLPLLATAAIACDRPPTPLAPVSEPDAAVVAELRRIGYKGPAIIAHRTITDADGTRPVSRGLYLPERGIEAIRIADAAGKGATASLRLHLATAAVVAPDDADPAHNSRIEDLETLARPSRLNGANPEQVRINFNLSFLGCCDPATGDFYVVPGGDVLEIMIRARDSSAGHWHGSVDPNQLSLPLRVGTFTPPTGTFTGSFATRWDVPQVSGELKTTFRIREIGGPNNGETNLFFSFAFDGVRVQGLSQMPAPGPTDRYVLEGGTNTHPEAFNDYATPTMRNAIRDVAIAFYNSTSVPATPTTPPVPGELTHVNDISLFYGGRFDVGRAVGGNLQACTDAATANCWAFSHFEHRLGNEVDIYNQNFGNPARRARFYNALRTQFPSIRVEGDHYHARTALSVYR